MRRVAAVAVLLLSLTTFENVFANVVTAQNARERQAAAEAYDRGTTAYVDQAYAEAAVWFETANRMAPAAPALMQAIRAHEKAENFPRAATLALELQTSYRDDTTAAEFSKELLGKYSATLVKVEVTCDEDCKLDVDGKLEEYMSFFVTPVDDHTVTATFETGSKALKLQGDAGETKDLAITAPPAPPIKPVSMTPTSTSSSEQDGAGRPLPPLVTWIGLGLTVALGGATIASGIHALDGVPAYKDAVSAAEPCLAMPVSNRDQACVDKVDQANDLLEDGRSRELRTNILIGATAAAAVGTGVIAFLLTDWSGGDEKAQNQASHGRGARSMPTVELHAWPGGAATVLKGRF
jgi:hypothetical protein